MVKAFIGALSIAAVSTLGDFIWATWVLGHLPLYGLIHGTLLLFCIGLYLGIVEHRPVRGAVSGALVGLIAAASFYVLRPLAGYSAIFAAWAILWLLLAVVAGPILCGAPKRSIKGALTRGIVAATFSGLTFYAISGIWRPFNPRGWDYAVHFLSWTIAYLPGFLALTVWDEWENRASLTETI